MNDQIKSIKWVELLINAAMVILPLGTLILTGFMSLKTEQAIFATKMDTVLKTQESMKIKVEELLKVESRVDGLADKIKNIERYDFGKMQQLILHNQGDIARLRDDFYREKQTKLVRSTSNNIQ